MDKLRDQLEPAPPEAKRLSGGIRRAFRQEVAFEQSLPVAGVSEKS